MKLKEITVSSNKLVWAGDELIGSFKDLDWSSDLLWFEPTGVMQIGKGFNCTKNIFEFDLPTALISDLTDYIEKSLTSHINLLTIPNVN